MWNNWFHLFIQVPTAQWFSSYTSWSARVWVLWESCYRQRPGLGKHWRIMAPHSSTLAWKIPWTEGPGGLQSMGSLRVGHDWATSLSLFTFMHWRRKWQPTPVFLPGESQGWGEPGGLPSMGLPRVRHNRSNLAAAAAMCKNVLDSLFPSFHIFF